MHDDLIDAVDWAVARGYADPDRVAIAGGSYGGYAALVGVTVTPHKFAAAVDYVGISDLANFLATLPPFVRANMTNNWIAYVGDPDDPEQLAEMRRRSPITMVDRIRTPLLVAQGANDVRVVQAESDNIVAPLRERGVPVTYLVADDEGHGFDNPENQIMPVPGDRTTPRRAPRRPQRVTGDRVARGDPARHAPTSRPAAPSTTPCEAPNR